MVKQSSFFRTLAVKIVVENGNQESNRVVSLDQGQNLALAMGPNVGHMETSAKTNINVSNVSVLFFFLLRIKQGPINLYLADFRPPSPSFPCVGYIASYMPLPPTM